MVGDLTAAMAIRVGLVFFCSRETEIRSVRTAATAAAVADLALDSREMVGDLTAAMAIRVGLDFFCSRETGIRSTTNDYVRARAYVSRPPSRRPFADFSL
ncbi:hypothetical protein K1719_011701 [Acacia pycnantha]|nr:hypothetical protein K1719_011701 [Acacia pycnantha]